MDKKWLWGCGGCLVVVIVIAIVAGVLLWMGASQLGEMGTKANQEIFGSSDAPSGYVTTFGIQMEDTNMVLLMNQATDSMLLAMKMPDKKGEFKQLQEDPQKAMALMEGMMAQSGQGRRGSMKFVGITSLKLVPGKHFAMKSLMEKDGQTSPAVMTILPYPDDHMAMLMMISLSPSGGEDEDTYADMADSLSDVINESKLSDELILIDPEAAHAQKVNAIPPASTPLKKAS